MCSQILLILLSLLPAFPIFMVTDKIQRALNDVGVRVAMRLFVTIGKSLPSPKDPLDVNEITGIIYQVPCHDSLFVYIGQTKRDLKSRLSEHKRAIKYQRPEKFALREHSITLDHIIDCCLMCLVKWRILLKAIF